MNPACSASLGVYEQKSGTETVQYEYVYRYTPSDDASESLN